MTRSTVTAVVDSGAVGALLIMGASRLCWAQSVRCGTPDEGSSRLGEPGWPHLSNETGTSAGREGLAAPAFHS